MHTNCSIHRKSLSPFISLAIQEWFSYRPPCICSSFQPDHALSQRQNRYHNSRRAIVVHIANEYFSHVQKCVCCVLIPTVLTFEVCPTFSLSSKSIQYITKSYSYRYKGYRQSKTVCIISVKYCLNCTYCELFLFWYCKIYLKILFKFLFLISKEYTEYFGILWIFSN